jgi:hypothetical protein
MNRYIYVIGILLLVIVSCKKEKFPDEFSVYGKWKEFTTDTIRTEIEFKKWNYLVIQLREDTTREYRYLLNKPNELEIFDESEYPSGRRDIHRVTYNNKEEQMTIYGLYPVTSGDQSATVFVRR